MYVRGMIPLELDERVLYTVEPDLQGNTIAMGCAVAFGLLLFLLPGLILLLIFFLQREKVQRRPVHSDYEADCRDWVGLQRSHRRVPPR